MESIMPGHLTGFATDRKTKKVHPIFSPTDKKYSSVGGSRRHARNGAVTKSSSSVGSSYIPIDIPRRDPTTVTGIIAQQVAALAPPGYKLVKVDDNTLRVHYPRKGTGVATNVDIRYIPGRDLYQVDAFRVKGVDVEHTTHLNDIYADQLGEIIREARNPRKQPGRVEAYNEQTKAFDYHYGPERKSAAGYEKGDVVRFRRDAQGVTDWALGKYAGKIIGIRRHDETSENGAMVMLDSGNGNIGFASPHQLRKVPAWVCSTCEADFYRVPRQGEESSDYTPSCPNCHSRTSVREADEDEWSDAVKKKAISFINKRDMPKPPKR
jgi:DNA-directed RNA polymerase subunit RPC12/RpoP